MNNAPILVFDSGVGGLPYLASLKKLLPGERFEYLADAAHFPYGRRTREDLERVVLSVLGEAIRALEPKLVVIACNTASQAALAAVRARHPGLPVVGTVPAVKPAADSSRKRVIGVLATAAAVEDPYLDELVARHAQGVSVVRRGAQDLVEFVEHRLLDAGPEERRAACASAIAPLVEAGVDRIVLACTHFLHVAEDLAAVAGEGVETVDSRAGVARRVADIISERGLRSGQALATGGSLHATGSGELDATLSRFAERFELARGRSFGTLP